MRILILFVMLQGENINYFESFHLPCMPRRVCFLWRWGGKIERVKKVRREMFLLLMETGEKGILMFVGKEKNFGNFFN